jgi:hypothetical protein
VRQSRFGRGAVGPPHLLADRWRRGPSSKCRRARESLRSGPHRRAGDRAGRDCSPPGYQTRRTRVLAIQLRAQEHKEEGVLRLGSIVGEIEPRMQMWLWQLKNTPQQVNPGQTEPSLWVRACPGVRLQVGIGCIGSRRIGKTTARHAPRYERFAWALHSPILPTCPHDGEAL